MKLFLRSILPVLVLAGLLTAVAWTDTTASDQSSGRAPVAACSDPVHEFGTIKSADGTVECTFEIRNSGDLPLMIKKVHAGCGCTRTGKYTRAIEPGKTGEVQFYLDPDKLPSGPFNRSATVYTSDPKNPTLVVRMTGICKHPVDVSPYAASFGLKLEKEPSTKTITITNNTDKHLELKMQPVSEVDRKKFDVELIETEPGKTFEFRVTTKPPYERGTTTSVIYKFDTNLDAMKQVKVPTSIISPKRIDMRPSAIILKNTSAGGAGVERRIVSIRMFDEKPIKVTGFQVDTPKIKVKETFKREGQWYRYQVDIPANIDLPDKGQTLTFKLDDEKTPELKLPIIEPKATPRPANLVGEPAPTFSLETLEGKPVASGEFGKHPATVLNFVAEQCPFCKRQVPNVEKVRAEYEDRGVRFVNVVGPFHGKLPPEETIRQTFDGLGSKLDIAIDEGNKVARLYNANSFPSLVIVDRKGVITYALTGAKPDIDRRLKQQLDRMLGDGPAG